MQEPVVRRMGYVYYLTVIFRASERLLSSRLFFIAGFREAFRGQAAQGAFLFLTGCRRKKF